VYSDVHRTRERLGDEPVQLTLCQVRHLFAACGLRVTALERMRFGEWTPGDLPGAEWRAEWRTLPLPCS
jgi:hypothetical protein